MNRKNIESKTRKIIPAGMAVLLSLSFMIITAGCSSSGHAEKTEAVYLGVDNYGAEETNKDNRDSFLYRFEIDGKEEILAVDNGPVNSEGGFDYPIQNILKEGYYYEIQIEDGIVTGAEEIKDKDAVSYEPPVSGVPGEKTLENFLRTALEPVGTTLYIYGGGWDWQDEGSSLQTRTIGVSEDWVRFFNSQDENFTFKNKDDDEANMDPASSFYPFGGYNEYYYAGLDCSGYLGWVLYNTLNENSGEEGFVRGSTGFAKSLADMGFGTWTQDVSVPDGSDGTSMKPGDIMSLNGHVWISLGTCSDGSVVILHSTPSTSRTGQPGGGVQIGAAGCSEDCEAFRLADSYMSKYYPEWYSRYGVSLKEPEKYFSFEGDSAGKFSWDISGKENGFTDPEGYQKMSPEKVLSVLFNE